MKNLTKTLIALSMVASTANAAQLLGTDTNTTSFVIGGEIAATCKTTHTTQNATGINLGSAAAQTVASVNVWCNNGNMATTTYSSTNNGKLVSGSNEISYLMNVTDTATDVNLTSDQTVSQAAGAGTDGTVITKDIQIKPQVNGLETAGTYSDTITVTVTAQ